MSNYLIEEYTNMIKFIDQSKYRTRNEQNRRLTFQFYSKGNKYDGRLMVVGRAGETYDDNIELNLYYDPADRGYTEHAYIGLYKNKAIRAVGKIVAIVEADLINGKLIIKNSANVTSKQEKDILEAIKRGINHGYNIEIDHKFFLVDKFYNTNYEKTSKQSLRGKKFFDIGELFPKDIITGAEMLAFRLNDMTWQ